MTYQQPTRRSQLSGLEEPLVKWVRPSIRNRDVVSSNPARTTEVISLGETLKSPHPYLSLLPTFFLPSLMATDCISSGYRERLNYCCKNLFRYPANTIYGYEQS